MRISPKTKRRIILVSLLTPAFLVFAGVVLCEVTLHLPHRALNPANPRISGVLENPHQEVQITSADGLKLRGWYFPNGDSEATMLMVHGQSANREQMVPFVQLFLKHGFNVLAPDLRGHGESEGHEITYGLKEPRDIQLWVDWLEQSHDPRFIFGLGESLGAAILLQSVPVEKRFTGIIAECPYANFREVAYDRMGYPFGLGPWFGKTLLWPTVESGLLCAKYWDGLDLDKASPEKAVQGATIPILLIHGNKDFLTPEYHSELIRWQNPSDIELWEANNARHVRALFTDRQEYEERVFEWIGRQMRATDL